MAKPGADVIVANHHTGPIIFARIYEPNVTGNPTNNKIMFDKRMVPAGEAIAIPKVEWAMRLDRQPLIGVMMDRGWISIGKRVGEVDFRTQSLSDLVVPPHLAGDSAEDESKTPTGGRVAAALDKKRTKPGTATI